MVRPLSIRAATIAALLLVGAAGARAVPLWFPGQVTLKLTAPVASVVSLDINGDGLIELVEGQEDGWVSVLRLLPGGQFGALASLLIGGRVVELGVLPPGPGGGPELVALTANPDRAVLLRWTGDVEMPLEAYGAVPLDEDPGGLAVGLAPEGGARRCAVTLPGIDVWDLIGETPTGWAVLQEIATGDRPLTAARLDLDADGTPELITADNGWLSRGLSVFRRAADGSYGFDRRLATPGAPDALLPFDSDRDGTAELFVGYADSSFVSRYDAAGGGLVPALRIAAPLPANGLDLAALSATEVGLWSWNADRGTVSIFRNVGAGWSFVESYFAGGRAVDAQMSDLNLDGWPDLVVANGASQNLGLLYGNNLHRFRGYLVTPLPAAPVTTLLRDEDGDGHLDFLVACHGGFAVSILHGDGLGHFLARTAPLTFDRGPLGLASLHADGDALADLAVGLPELNRVALRRRLPDGSYASLPDLPTGQYPGDIAAGDLDGDGFDDLVVANVFGNSITLAYGAGDGTFPDQRTLSPGVPCEKLILADLNRDGLPDIVADDGVSFVYTILNQGGRVFQTPQFYQLTLPAEMATADLDGDGDPDLVVARGGSESISVFENLGTGWLFQRSLSPYLGGRAGSLCGADVDLDGRVDIVATVPDQQRVGIMLNRGQWRFTDAISFVSAVSPGGLAVGDINEDAVPDFAVLDQSLDLALAMLNVPPNPLPVARPALAAACAQGALEVSLAPGAASWRLEGAAGAGWTLLATAGGALFGELRPAGAGLALDLDQAARDAARLVPDGAGRFVFRLSEEGSPFAIATVDAGCAAPATAAEPAALLLLPPSPNPGNPATAVRFRLAKAARVSAAVVDAAGRRVARLGTANYGAGEHELRWDGRAADGRRAGSGVYLIVVSADGRTATRRVTLVR